MALHIPKKGIDVKSPFEHLGLRDCPFPGEAVLNPYSQDERKNGTIYAASIAQPQIEKFERLLIRPDDFTNRARLAYLWSKGDQESGRGMGKTALLQYFRQRINRDWGNSEFEGRFSAVVVYVSFPSQVDRRFMEQLAFSGLVDVCKNGVLHAARASLRLGALTVAEGEAVMKDEGGDENPENLLNNEILLAKNISPIKLDLSVRDTLTGFGVPPVVAHALANGTFEQYLRSLRKDGNLEPFYVPRDTKVLDLSRTLLFNDIVNFLRAANFAGGYLFIDDIENLVDQMARKERIEFAKEFGLCTVRPGYANTAHSFFSSVLTTHQQASLSLASAWGEAGLASIAKLDPLSANSVELPLPSKDQAREIVVAHLDHYRLNSKEKGSIKPFTDDGMDALLNNRQNLHPRQLLSTAYGVASHAVANKYPRIDAKCVNEACVSSATSTSVADVTDGIDGAV